MVVVVVYCIFCLTRFTGLVKAIMYTRLMSGNCPNIYYFPIVFAAVGLLHTYNLGNFDFVWLQFWHLLVIAYFVFEKYRADLKANDRLIDVWICSLLLFTKINTIRKPAFVPIEKYTQYLNNNKILQYARILCIILDLLDWSHWKFNTLIFFVVGGSSKVKYKLIGMSRKRCIQGKQSFLFLFMIFKIEVRVKNLNTL